MVVPEGWVEKTLDELFDFSGGLSASRSQLSSYGYPYLHYGDIHGSTKTFVDVCKDKTIPHLDIPLDKVSNSALLKDGDVVFVDASEDDEGTSRHIVIRNAKNTAFISGLHTIVAKPKTDELDNLFKEFCFLSKVVKSQFKFYAAGTKVTGVNKVTIKKITLKFPVSKSEQHAIAEVLSDMDSYIALLEKLVAKKKAIKQGTMEELLTGKRRLPGFVGEWISINLAQKSILKARIGWQGLTTAEYRNDGYAFLITGTDFLDGRINWVSCHFVDKFRYDQDTNIQVKNDDVLITKDGTIGKAVLVEGLTKNATLNSGIFVIRPIKHAYDNLFVYFILTSEIFINFLAKLSAGSTINHLYQKDFIDFEFLAPPTIEEQKAIAQILLDMETEIDALTTNLNKTKLIKQGMMQELLTGKIRLVNVFPVQDEFTISEYMVILGIITKLFTDKGMKFLKHMRYQKLVYLYLVYKKVKTGIFEKWDFGPFSKKLAYTIVPKAENEKLYIATDNDKNICVGENIDEAVENALNKGYYKDAKQLAERIRYKKDTEMEVLATVIESIKDLEISKKVISLQTVKEYIDSIPIWKHKLSLDYFTDFEITKAIKEYYDFFK